MEIERAHGSGHRSGLDGALHDNNVDLSWKLNLKQVLAP